MAKAAEEKKAEKPAKKKVSRIKAKKKTWCKLLAPPLFGQKEIGESYLSKADVAMGRKLKVNLKELTGNVKDQNVSIHLQVHRLVGNTLQTALIGYEMSPVFVRRVVRKNTNRVDDYFSFKTKGGKQVILKTLLVTSHKAQRSVRKQLRRELQHFLQEEISRSSFDRFVESLVQYKVQSALKRSLRKTFPLKEAMVRVLLLREKSPTEEVVVDEPAAEAAPEEEASSQLQEAPEEMEQEDAEEDAEQEAAAEEPAAA